MNRPIDLEERRAARPSPFRVHSLGELHGKPIPPRDWLIPSVLIRRSITLFAGDGGVGKSLASMQLQVAAACGLEWLGLPIERPIPSFGFYCEDDKDELDRRFAKICDHYGVSMDAIGDMVRYTSRVGESENEMVTFRGKTEFAKPARTATFDQVKDEIDAWGTQLIILDTASDIFAGNENVRYQVKSFVTMLRSLALINNGGIMLNSHPSKSAMADGSGFSGSTAWNGAVRNRLYLSAPKPKVDEDDLPTDDRVLKIMKSNYSAFGEKIRLRWQDGVFVRTDRAGAGSLIDKLERDHRILSAAEYLIKRGEYLSPSEKARTALVNLSRTLPSCRDISFNAALDAQSRLLDSGRLVIVQAKRDGKWIESIRPAHLNYPEERPRKGAELLRGDADG